VASVLAREPASRVVLLYGNRTTQGILFRDALEALKDRHVERLSVTHILSREAQDVAVLNGRLDGDKVRRLVPTLVPPTAINHAFVCGPGAMIDDAAAALQSLGIQLDRIHAERFTPADDALPVRPAAPIPAADAPHAVADIVLDGSRLGVPVAPGEAILDAALRAGLDLPFSCRGGMCCTCRARVVEGAVEMAVNYSLQDWEIAAGYALTCQARPTTARVVIDYDQM
jgi:ring-1,2-phenylacetyl-CoA epoxidase subunit PaaE